MDTATSFEPRKKRIQEKQKKSQPKSRMEKRKRSFFESNFKKDELMRIADNFFRFWEKASSKRKKEKKEKKSRNKALLPAKIFILTFFVLTIVYALCLHYFFPSNNL